MRFILFTLLSVSFLFSQTLIDESNFNDKLNEDIVVIEFFAEWNKDNCVDLSKFKEVSTYMVKVEECPNLTSKYKVVSVPTVIIFYNKEEVERYEADLSFKLSIKDACKKTEELVLKKFM
tara:strand:- start:978 stop:1337 length:360 start_codon:yes stop_codon:yes gene_type:complete